jgi:phage gp37-like protein
VTHALVKKNANGGRVMSRAAKIAREASETHRLVKECRGRTGDEQSSSVHPMTAVHHLSLSRHCMMCPLAVQRVFLVHDAGAVRKLMPFSYEALVQREVQLCKPLYGISPKFGDGR